MAATGRPLIAQRYAVGRLIGRGGVAEVHEGRDLAHGGAAVAIKIIPGTAFQAPGAHEAFLGAAERRLPAHPSIVAVSDHGFLSDGGAYLVMELVEGGDLRQRLVREKRLSAAATLAILKDICSGVDAAHCAGIVHGDLKPENVLLPDDHSPARLADFIGIRQRAADGSLIGTPPYMAPEQMRGEPASPRTDVFSLGVMAFEMLTGALPFGRGGAGEVRLRHARGVPPMAAPGVSPCLERAVRAALEPDADRRPPSAAALAQLLDSAR